MTRRNPKPRLGTCVVLAWCLGCAKVNQQGTFAANVQSNDFQNRPASDTSSLLIRVAGWDSSVGARENDEVLVDLVPLEGGIASAVEPSGIITSEKTTWCVPFGPVASGTYDIRIRIGRRLSVDTAHGLVKLGVVQVPGRCPSITCSPAPDAQQTVTVRLDEKAGRECASMLDNGKFESMESFEVVDR